ncbi:MAG TPA: hypothetical protein VGA80_12745, partial [Flavobacteriaceae bacterium]
MKKNRSSDTPKLPDDNSLEIKSIEHPFKLSSLKDEKLKELIVDTINAMGAFGDNAEKQYQRYLKQLAKMEISVDVLQDEYSSLKESQYLDKWSIVQLASDLSNERNLTFFDRVIKEKIPKEKSKKPHSFSTVAEEVIIRTTAIDGICKLAAKGNKKAINSLLGHVDNENFSIKRAAVQAYTEVGGKNAMEILKKQLPKKFHSILEIKRT